MPNYKKTKVGNKKRNMAIQKKQEELKKQQEEQKAVHNFFITDTSANDMENWCKMVNIKIFQYFHNNLFVGEIGTPEANKIFSRIRRGIIKDNFCVIQLNGNGKEYVIRKEYWKKFMECCRKMSIPLYGKEEDHKKRIGDIKDLCWELVLNPPKYSGDKAGTEGNWNIGMFGSIWIDMKTTKGAPYRLGFYNSDGETIGKDYDCKKFCPRFQATPYEY